MPATVSGSALLGDGGVRGGLVCAAPEAAAVTSLGEGDEDFHHSDGSHRWSGGPADEPGQAAYQAGVKQHMDWHRHGVPAVEAPAPVKRYRRNERQLPQQREPTTPQTESSAPVRP